MSSGASDRKVYKDVYYSIMVIKMKQTRTLTGILEEVEVLEEGALAMPEVTRLRIGSSEVLYFGWCASSYRGQRITFTEKEYGFPRQVHQELMGERDGESFTIPKGKVNKKIKQYQL